MEARKRQKKQILYSNENQMKEKKSKNNHKTVLDYTTAVFLSILYFFCSLFFSSKNSKKKKYENYKIIREVERYLTIWPIRFQTKNHHHQQLNLIEERIEISFIFTEIQISKMKLIHAITVLHALSKLISEEMC